MIYSKQLLKFKNQRLFIIRRCLMDLKLRELLHLLLIKDFRFFVTFAEVWLSDEVGQRLFS